MTGGVADATGTPGDATQDTLKGRVAIAAGQQSITVTNSRVTDASIVMAQVQTDDGTMKTVVVVPANGSFLVKGNALSTGIVKIAWHLKE